jgi:periplasmic divalent cation tolerance protein
MTAARPGCEARLEVVQKFSPICWPGAVKLGGGNGGRSWEEVVAGSHCAVITTTDSVGAAEELGRGIVEARLGACVQIVGPIRSVYRWEGDVQNDQEWQCWIKTSTDRLDALTEHIKKNHSYDVPEVVALPIVGGSEDYLTWVTDETRPA